MRVKIRVEVEAENAAESLLLEWADENEVVAHTKELYREASTRVARAICFGQMPADTTLSYAVMLHASTPRVSAVQA